MKIFEDTTSSYANMVYVNQVDSDPTPPFKPGEHFEVAFDIDGIVLDTATEMWKVITGYLGLDWDISKWTDYDIGNIVGTKTKDLRHVYEPVLSRQDLPGIMYAGEVLNHFYYEYGKPLLFVTARRAQFKYAAVQSIRNILNPTVEFEVLCTGDIHEEEFRNDKLSLLKEYGVKIFVEDNHIYWENYIDNDIQVVSLNLPWTTGPCFELQTRGKVVSLFHSWIEMYHYIRGRLYE
jgi:hypothetical protein